MHTICMWFGNETRQNAAARWCLLLIAAFLHHLISRVPHILTFEPVNETGRQFQWMASFALFALGCGVLYQDWKCSDWKCSDWKHQAGKCRMEWPFSVTVCMEPSLVPRPFPSPVFLHTASDQKLEAGTAWERGYVGPWGRILASFPGLQSQLTRLAVIEGLGTRLPYPGMSAPHLPIRVVADETVKDGNKQQHGL